MRREDSRAFIRRAAEIAESIAGGPGEPTVVVKDVIERYCFVVSCIEQLEQSARDGERVDTAELLQLGEKLLKQARALQALPRPKPEPVTPFEHTLRTSFAEAMAASTTTYVMPQPCPPPAPPVPEPRALPAPDGPAPSSDTPEVLPPTQPTPSTARDVTPPKPRALPADLMRDLEDI